MVSERIYPTAPYDFKLMLQRPISRASRLFEIDLDAGSYTCGLRLANKVVAIRIVGSGTVDEPVLDVQLPDGLSDAEREECLRTIRFMFSVDLDMQNFVDQFSQDDVWAPLIHRFRGLRPILDANLFESMIKTIIGQQLNVQFAATLRERFVQLAGETVEWQGKIFDVFPSAEQVASWSYEQLRALSFSHRKAEYVIDFARAVANGQVEFNQLWGMSDEEVERALIPLRGIGKWTVECFLLFGMGRPDLMPTADVGVQNAVQKLYGQSHRPSANQLRVMAEGWRPWRSYATYYLWHSLIKDV